MTVLQVIWFSDVVSGLDDARVIILSGRQERYFRVAYAADFAF